MGIDFLSVRRVYPVSELSTVPLEYFVRFDLIAFFYSLYTFKSHQLANSSLTARNQISVKLRPLQSKTSRVGSRAPAFGPWPGRRPKACARLVTRREPVKWVKIPQEES